MNIIKFALRHKPTKKWVTLKHGTFIEFTDNVCDATLSPIGPQLEDTLKHCSLDGNMYYGRENFLEFKLEKVNIQYTIL